MIRFACPGCSTVFSLSDEKAGKVGKCPKCQAQFTIPLPEAPAPRPLPVPAPAPTPTVRCPVCRAKLAVTPNGLGSDVECPYCKTIFKLKLRGDDASPPPQQDVVVDAQPVPSGRAWEPEPPRRQSYDVDDEVDQQPSRRPRRRDDYDDEDDYDDRPRRKRSRRRSRGTGKSVPRIISAILSLLIGGSYILCGVLFAIAGSTIMGLIGGLAPDNQQGGNMRGLAGVGMGVFICCGLFAALFGGLYITAGIGALNRRSWGRIWTIVVAVLSCLNVLASLYGVGGIGDARGAGISVIQLLGFVGHAIASFMATFGEGAEAEFNR